MTCITKQTLMLLNKINAIDPMAAASYMLMLLDGDKKGLELSPSPFFVCDAFRWNLTKQGHDYWNRIDDLVDRSS